MNSKRTPWRAMADRTIRDSHSYEVATLGWHDHDNMQTARLLAAAPDLFAALNSMIGESQTRGGQLMYHLDVTVEHYKAAKKAIDKALL